MSGNPAVVPASLPLPPRLSLCARTISRTVLYGTVFPLIPHLLNQLRSVLQKQGGGEGGSYLPYNTPEAFRSASPSQFDRCGCPFPAPHYTFPPYSCASPSTPWRDVLNGPQRTPEREFP
jgi:hypothetical protein